MDGVAFHDPMHEATKKPLTTVAACHCSPYSPGRQSRPHLFHVVRKVCTKSGHVSTIPPVVKNNSHHGISTIKSDYPSVDDALRRTIKKLRRLRRASCAAGNKKAQKANHLARVDLANPCRHDVRSQTADLLQFAFSPTLAGARVARWPHQAHLEVKTKWLVQCERAIVVSGKSLYLFNSCLGYGRAAAVMKKALNLADQGFFKT